MYCKHQWPLPPLTAVTKEEETEEGAEGNDRREKGTDRMSQGAVSRGNLLLPPGTKLLE